ncbi:MAG TPA: tetratricopeptide repeat protein [Bryobacteraceae bacterium]|nr:tetratricopeptide repeat protein [Bryobacteraceae bacterium]
MDAEVYPDERVVKFVSENFIPLRIHIKENPEGFKRFGAQWTPTVVVSDPGGTERYRFEGFLPADEFLPQLELGLAKAAFANNKFDLAERRYRDIVAQFPNSEVAPEAQYWAGVSKYKASNDAAALGETAKAFQSRYSDSAWAKKASVWAG